MLMHKGMSFQRSLEYSAVFDKLKANLLGPKIMAYPMREDQLYFDCDACDVSIGAVLCQIQGDDDQES